MLVRSLRQPGRLPTALSAPLLCHFAQHLAFSLCETHTIAGIFGEGLPTRLRLAEGHEREPLADSMPWAHRLVGMLLDVCRWNLGLQADLSVEDRRIIVQLASKVKCQFVASGFPYPVQMPSSPANGFSNYQPASWKPEPNAVIYKARGVPIYGWIGVADRLKRRAAEAQVSRWRCGNTDGPGNRPGTGMWECPCPMAACDRGGAAQPCSARRR